MGWKKSADLGNLVKSSINSKLQTNGKITGTCCEQLSYSISGCTMSVLAEEDFFWFFLDVL
jgi:hypothetical protein